MLTNNNGRSGYNRKAIDWVKDAWHLAKPYWSSNRKYKALALISTVIMLNLAYVYITVVANSWYNDFYDALQRYDKDHFAPLVIKFCWIAFFNVLFQLLSFYIRKYLEIDWRRWMTDLYLTKWLTNQAYYKTRFTEKIDNPDQRVSEDIGGFIGTTLDLSLGLLTSIVSLCSFVTILWHLSGSFNFTMAGHKFYLPGYMVWLAVAYATIGTYITFKIGKPLVKLNFKQQAYEADFRFGLLRVREYSEDIAFYNGETQERLGLTTKFHNVVDNFMQVVKRTLKINGFNFAYGQTSVLFPLLINVPRYLAKSITLGQLMQINSAFGRVQDALSYFLDAYTSLAGWRAVMDRLYGFEESVSSAASLEGLIKALGGNSLLKVKDLSLKLPDSRLLVSKINFDLNAGDRLLIRGRSGSGKTTLLRALAGLWPYVSGEINQALGKNELFVGQRPYVPGIKLRDVITYPQINADLTVDDIAAIMKECDLPHLLSRLDEFADWGKILSLGEQQRLAFVRILVNKPDIIYLDEATSALDEEMEQHLYQLLIDRLSASVIISVGHRSTLKQWHNQELNFNQLQSV